MMKVILASLLAALPLTGIVAPAPAQATEINTDVGCDNAGAWMPGTGWSVTGSKCVATSATRMAMLMQNSTAIKANHRIKITFDLSGYTGGILRPFAGVKMPSAPTGSWVTLASVTPIADNFTTTDGLTSSAVYHSLTGPGDDGEQNGSWRITCLSAGFARIDPLVYPGLQAPHLHEFLGASNIGKNWTYIDFRTKAQSSCNNLSDPQHTINRSGYWMPAMLDGSGRPKRVYGPMLVYYKGPPSTTVPESITVTGRISGNILTVSATSVASPITPDGVMISGAGVPAGMAITQQLSGTPGDVGTYTLSGGTATVSSETITLKSPYNQFYGNPQGTAASMCSQMSTTTDCQNVPTALRYTWGYKGSCNAIASPLTCLGPFDTDASTNGDATAIERTSSAGVLTYQCVGGPNNEGAPWDVGYTSQFPTLQSIMDSGQCNVIGSLLLRNLVFPSCWDGTNVDSPNHRDHMSYGNSHATFCLSAHAVRIPAIQLVTKYLVDADLIAGKWHLSSDEMAACYDTGGLAGCTEHADYWEAWSPTVRAAWYANCNFAHNSCTGDFGTGRLKEAGPQWTTSPIQQLDSKNAAETYGMSRNVTANGSYTFYITSVDDGVWGFLAMKNFSGSIDNIHVTDLGAASKGPVTAH